MFSEARQDRIGQDKMGQEKTSVCHSLFCMFCWINCTYLKVVQENSVQEAMLTLLIQDKA